MILRAAWLIPVETPPLYDGFAEIRDGRIVAVGPWSEHAPCGAAPVERLDAILTPGLVNPHTHLELGCYAGLFSPGPFWPWILRLAALRAEPSRVEHERRAAEEWAWRSLRAGVTCVGDISRRNVAWRALRHVPIRKVCYAELLSLAALPPRTPEELARALDEIVEDDLLTAGVTPHAPYSVPPHHFRAAIELAASRQRPWTTHLAETPEEVAFLAGDHQALPPPLAALMLPCQIHPPRRRPVQFLAECAAGLPPGSIAHANYVPDREWPSLAASGHVVIYCPRAHAFFGHAPHPFRRMQAAGVRVAIGTDSPASNDDVSMLAELHHVWTKLADPPAPAHLFRMATLDAAAALGLQTRIGSLTPGKYADLVAWPLPAQPAPGLPSSSAPRQVIDRTQTPLRPEPTNFDPLRWLIEHAPAPVAVWVAGRRVL